VRPSVSERPHATPKNEKENILFYKKNRGSAKGAVEKKKKGKHCYSRAGASASHRHIL
jgi:stalled ribosome alternative rescue factor ArfA